MRILSKIIGVVFFLMVGLIAFTQENLVDKSKEKSVLVLSERVEQANSQYLIYPEVSEMIASEIVNILNMNRVVSAPSLSRVREEIKKPELVRSANRLLNDYRYTYELDYAALRKIAQNFNTTNVLIVTGGLDTVSDFLKPTWWNFLNVPGENVVKTEYRLYTYIALVDLTSETIKWQNTYHRQITAPEFALASATYSPDYKQLSKIKKGSMIIAKDAAYRVETLTEPAKISEIKPPNVREFLKHKVNKKYDNYVQNISEFKKKKGGLDREKNSSAIVVQEKELIPAVEETKINLQKDTVISPVIEDSEVVVEPLKDDINLEEAQNKGENKNIYVSPLNIIIPKM